MASSCRTHAGRYGPQILSIGPAQLRQTTLALKRLTRRLWVRRKPQEPGKPLLATEGVPPLPNRILRAPVPCSVHRRYPLQGQAEGPRSRRIARRGVGREKRFGLGQADPRWSLHIRSRIAAREDTGAPIVWAAQRNTAPSMFAYRASHALRLNPRECFPATGRRPTRPRFGVVGLVPQPGASRAEAEPARILCMARPPRGRRLEHARSLVRGIEALRCALSREPLRRAHA
jgi:hypothetical protein